MKENKKKGNGTAQLDDTECGGLIGQPRTSLLPNNLTEKYRFHAQCILNRLSGEPFTINI